MHVSVVGSHTVFVNGVYFQFEESVFVIPFPGGLIFLCSIPIEVPVG